jgi:hypothetical protein
MRGAPWCALSTESLSPFVALLLLYDLKAEAEALQDACDFLLGKAENIKRHNTWIRA